jgi:hypothetical protein
VESKSTTLKCRNCGGTKNLMKCTSCSSAAYCSKNCQTADWPIHKMFCKMFSKVESAKNELVALGTIYKACQKQGVEHKRFIDTCGLFHL